MGNFTLEATGYSHAIPLSNLKSITMTVSTNTLSILYESKPNPVLTRPKMYLIPRIQPSCYRPRIKQQFFTLHARYARSIMQNKSGVVRMYIATYYSSQVIYIRIVLLYGRYQNYCSNSVDLSLQKFKTTY